VSDPYSPAHRATLGGDVVKTFTSPLLLTAEQALSAAYTLLAKHSAPARTLSLSMVPNPALDAGDSITVEWPGAQLGGVDSVRIQQIVHPLGRGEQKITAMPTGGATDDFFDLSG
jgi:hypothetical protein